MFIVAVLKLCIKFSLAAFIDAEPADFLKWWLLVRFGQLALLRPCSSHRPGTRRPESFDNSPTQAGLVSRSARRADFMSYMERWCGCVNLWWHRLASFDMEGDVPRSRNQV